MRLQHGHLQALDFNFFQQNSPISIGGEMNADLSCFSVDIKTLAEIEELSLRAPRPVALPK
ncbi:hypothetical protein ACFTQ7_09100 [Lysinibacillus sp. NPDC056959]|uniref:hypothetical protein n=1 Tax=Lysinibacillus sp. NPDC056959 TaxID=3345981 RepID=UPI00363B0B86